MGKYHKGIRIEGADEFLLAVNITGHGAPTEDTEAEPGMCYLDEDSEHGDLYKCIGVLVTETGTVYRWKKLAGQEEVERLSEAIADKADKTLKSADGDSWEVAVESGGDVVTHKTAGAVEIVAGSLESATLSDKVLTLTGITGTYGAVIIPDATEISIDVPANVEKNPYFADPNGWQNPSFGWFFLRTDSGYIAVHTTNYAEVYKVSADLKTWSSIGGATANVAQETMRVVLDNGNAKVYSDDIATYSVDGITGIGYCASSIKVLTIYGMTVIHGQSVGNGAVDLTEVNERLDTLDKAVAELGGTLTEPAEDDIPKVFFGGALQQTKNEAVVPFSYRSKTLSFDCYAEIKAQGNSTLSWPKKNQTVKLYADAECTEKLKIDFKGWGKQNKFVIKANWRDLTHVRDIVSVRLEGDCLRSNPDYDTFPELLKTSPNMGGIDGFPVVVYADGVYQGRYMWNIPKDKWMTNMDDELDEHCILCSEDYNSGCFRAAANINGSDWTDEIHDTVPDSIKTRWNEIISFVMNSSDDEFVANLDSYIKVSTLIDRHLMGLLSCDFDGYGKNQLYITYDGQQWYADRYDKDGTWGNYWTGDSMLPSDYGREQYEDFTSTQSDGSGNLLFIRLEKLFWAELQTRWAELRVNELSIPNIINRFRELYDITPPYLIEEDYASTTANGAFTGIPNKSTCTIQQIQKFVVERHAWTDEYVAGLTPKEEVPCTGITLDKSELVFDGKETQTITATITPSDTTDTISWKSSDTSIATVSNGVVTPIANGDCVITVNCGTQSATCEVKVNMIPTPYLKNDGVAYIDLGINSADGYSYEICMQDEEIPSDKADSVYFGNRFNNFAYKGQTFMAWALKGQYNGLGNSADNKKHAYKVDATNQYFDGEISATATWGSSSNHPSMLLFGANYINGASGFYLAQLTRVIKFYYLKIWNGNGELIHSYVPSLKDGVACVYDEVVNNYLYSANEGVFTYGEE